MSHDPLCIIASLDPTSYDYEERAYYECECDLIAAVRADERTNEPPAGAYANGYAAALLDAVEMAREKHFAVMEHGKQSCSVHGCDGCHLSSYLGEVIAAIEALGDTPQQQAKEHINPAGYDPAATDNRP